MNDSSDINFGEKPENQASQENQEHNIDLKTKPTKGLIAGVAVVALLIVAGFISFNLFFKSSTPKTITPEPETINETVLGSETTPSAEASPSPNQPQGQTNGQSSTQTNTSPSGQVQGQTTSTWTAVYHTGGSISGESYTVKRGDTLWEIARGRYGKALERQKIADANNISFDSLGHPILHSGDVLKLPE